MLCHISWGVGGSKNVDRLVVPKDKFVNHWTREAAFSCCSADLASQHPNGIRQRRTGHPDFASVGVFGSVGCRGVPLVPAPVLGCVFLCSRAHSSALFGTLSHSVWLQGVSSHPQYVDQLRGLGCSPHACPDRVVKLHVEASPLPHSRPPSHVC